MRILLINNYYPPFEIGGYEQVCRDVATRLAERRHQIGVLTSTYGVDPQHCTPENDVHRLLRLQPNYGSTLHAAAQFFFSRRRNEAHNLKSLCAIIGEFHPQVILIANLEYLPAALATASEEMPDVGVAYWIAGWSPRAPDAFRSYWKRPALRPVGRVLKPFLAKVAIKIMESEGKPKPPRMKHTAVVSDYLRQRGIASGVLPSNARVVYNGVEVGLFHRHIRHQPDGEFAVLQAGRVCADKGVHATVEAIGVLVREFNYDRVHLYVAGSGPPDYRARLQQIVARYGIADKVSFLGWLPREALPDLMAQCHVLALPTESPEPFARVVLEAMAAGLAVVATLTGGTGEIIRDETTGLTVPAGDSWALAHQIRRLASDPELRVRLAANGQQLVVDHFDLDHMVASLEELLLEAYADRVVQ